MVIMAHHSQFTNIEEIEWEEKQYFFWTGLQAIPRIFANELDYTNCVEKTYFYIYIYIDFKK